MRTQLDVIPPSSTEEIVSGGRERMRNTTLSPRFVLSHYSNTDIMAGKDAQVKCSGRYKFVK